MRNFMLFVILIGIVGVFSEESEQPRTRVKQGEIIGTTYETYSGRKVLGFYGLPYAAPPVKERRFEPPFPPEPWNTPKIATNRSDFCLQLFLLGPVISVGSEDCLYLDVYTPKVPDKEGKCEKLYPVLFFIHPSAAIATSGVENQPYYMMDKHDIVFVPINYRLGILGALTTDDETVPGNNLYKDHVAALKWVKENIRSFCGNPDLITVSGSSQGSTATALFMLSPLTKGLFHRAIGTSGTAFFYLTFHAEGKEVGKTVANQLNCPTGNSKEMVECLKLKNADLFFDFDLQFRPFLLTPLEVFGGTIEKCHEGAFLSKTPVKALADGDLAQNIPMMNLESIYEGLIYVFMLAIPGATELLDLTYKKNFKYMFDLYHMMPPHLFENTSEAIKKEYFGDGLITGNELAFKKMASDGFFSQGFYEQVTRYARHSNSPVYNFRNYYRGVFSTSTAISLVQTNKNYGTAHYDSSLYAVFDGLSDKKIRLKKKDKAMMEFMTELFYSFMVDGKPSVADKLGWTPQPPTAGEEVHYLHFDDPYRMHMAKEDNYGNHKFWTSLPIHRYYGYPDDFCELSGNKTENNPHHHHQNTDHQSDEEQQKKNEENWRRHDQQLDCDQDVQKQMQQDKLHHEHRKDSQNQQDQQLDCDPNNKKQTQEDKLHDQHRQDLQNQHDQQLDCDQNDQQKQVQKNKLDHRQDLHNQQDRQSKENLQRWLKSHKSR